MLYSITTQLVTTEGKSAGLDKMNINGISHKGIAFVQISQSIVEQPKKTTRQLRKVARKKILTKQYANTISIYNGSSKTVS